MPQSDQKTPLKVWFANFQGRAASRADSGDKSVESIILDYLDKIEKDDIISQNVKIMLSIAAFFWLLPGWWRFWTAETLSVADGFYLLVGAIIILLAWFPWSSLRLKHQNLELDLIAPRQETVEKLTSVLEKLSSVQTEIGSLKQRAQEFSEMHGELSRDESFRDFIKRIDKVETDVRSSTSTTSDIQYDLRNFVVTYPGSVRATSEKINRLLKLVRENEESETEASQQNGAKGIGIRLRTRASLILKIRTVRMESSDLIALIGRAYARERRRGADDWTAFRAALDVLATVEPPSDSIRCASLIAQAAERYGPALYRRASYGGDSACR